LAKDRFGGRDANECARAFQKGVALGVFNAATALCVRHDSDTIVLSGGVFQNELLLEDLKSMSASMPLKIWTNRAVPPNDGGISLGQAALASFTQFDDAESWSSKESVSR
jgi:hydrogenase maturation protein HypF